MTEQLVPNPAPVATGWPLNVARMRAKRLWADQLRRSFRIDWRRGTPRQLMVAHAQWDTAVQAAAATKSDAGLLIALLRSDTPLHRDARDLLADLLACRRLSRKRGGQTTPGRISEERGRLLQQAKLARHWASKGLSIRDATRAALRDFMRQEEPNFAAMADARLDEGITEQEINRLENFLLGKRGYERRARNRQSG